jgi:hypothetical protein
MRRLSDHPRLIAAFIAGLIVVSLGQAVVLGATFVKSGALDGSGGRVSAVYVAGSERHVETQSVKWRVVPGMSTTVNVSNSENALLLITFSGVQNCYKPYNPPGVGAIRCATRVVVDGHPIQDYDTGFGVTSNDSYGPRSMQWATMVKSGAHTVSIEWVVSNHNGVMQFEGFMMSVLQSSV